MDAGRRVFILDDDLAWRTMLVRWIKEWGYEPFESSSSEGWETVLRAEKLDLILVDPSSFESDILPVVLEAAGTSETPVIVLSDTSSAARALDLGASDFLAKPCHPTLVRSRIRAQFKILEARSLLVRVNEDLEARVRSRTDELEKLNQLFLRFVPRQFQQKIRSTFRVEPGIYNDARVTIMFLDVRGFTGIAERLGPEKSVKLLGDLFQKFVPMISRHGGYIDNFGGDSLMAIFEGKSSAEQAAQAAIEIQRWVFSMYDPKFKTELETVRVGVGINTGHVVYAAIGSHERITSTVIGDQVNLSARIEKLTKAFQSQVLITASTFSELPKHIQEGECRLVDNLRVRGRNAPIEVYELFAGDPDWIREKKREIHELFRSAMAAYADCQFEDALEIFRDCLKLFPQDAVSLEYARRCRYFMKARPESGFFERGIAEGETFFDPVVRRRLPRYEVGTEMDFEIHQNDANQADVQHRIVGRLLNLSAEGMMIESAQLPRLGSIFSLRASFRGTPLEKALGDRIRQFVCQVRWKRDAAGRVGLSFIQLSKEDEKLLSDALISAGQEGSLTALD